MNNQETESQNNLTEFENEKPPKKQQNVGVQVLIGIFFIGYGIFRLSNTLQSDGNWNTFFGWTMIILGIVRVGSVALNK